MGRRRVGWRTTGRGDSGEGVARCGRREWLERVIERDQSRREAGRHRDSDRIGHGYSLAWNDSQRVAGGIGLALR